VHVDGGECSLVDAAAYGLAEDIGGLPAQLQYFLVVPGRQRREFVLADPARADNLIHVTRPGDIR
jgi:hypothetical protein